jgi:hypothetical protein
MHVTAMRRNGVTDSMWVRCVTERDEPKDSNEDRVPH